MEDTELSTNVILDGGWAATLQEPGLHCSDVDEEWVRTRPDEVAATHGRFAMAGAQILFTDTLKLMPHLEDDWEEIADRAVQLAQQGAGAAVVWGTIGPVSSIGKPWADTDFNERKYLMASWAALARRYVLAGVKGIALTRFTDATECAAAVEAVHGKVIKLPITACLCPRDDGRLVDGSEPSDALIALRQAGASWVGFDCGTGPQSIEAALSLAPEADWVKPSRGDLDDEQLFSALLRLSAKCRFVGGCCGVDPGIIEALNRATHLPFRSLNQAASR